MIELSWVVDWLQKHVRLLSLLVGSLLICLWALLRFFTVPSVFDLLGQQLLARQWAAEYASHAFIGTTNYIWKMLLLYIPLDVLPGSPRLKLIVLTLMVNVATFVLLVMVLERLLRMLKIKTSPAFYAGMLWLGAIAGSVFWVQFTNSRNFEVVGGVYLLYLGVRLLKSPSWRPAAGCALFSAVLFFADPLQTAMTALPLVVYGLWLLAMKQLAYRPIVQLGAALAAGFAGSKVLLLLATRAFGLTFTDGPGFAGVLQLGARQWAADAALSVKSLLELYAGGYELGHIATLSNLLVLAVVTGCAGYAVWRRRVSKQLSMLVVSVVCVDLAVYFLSGQALVPTTARYLIMTVPMAMLAFAVAGQMRLHKLLTIVTLLAVVLNALLLTGALHRAWPTRFSGDDHLAATAAYLQQQPYPYAYASLDTAIPTMYYYRPAAPIVPLTCVGHHLAKTYLFYDRAAAAHAEWLAATYVPLFLDGQAITSSPNSCAIGDLIQQLGQPTATGLTTHGDTVLIYPAATLRSLPVAQ